MTAGKRPKPPPYVACLACWIERVYGKIGKTHSGSGPRCPAPPRPLPGSCQPSTAWVDTQRVA